MQVVLDTLAMRCSKDESAASSGKGPTARFAHTALAMDVEGDAAMLVVGGMSEQQDHNDVWLWRRPR